MNETSYWKDLKDQGLIIKGASLLRLRLLPEMLSGNCVLLVRTYSDNRESKIWRQILFDKEFALEVLDYHLKRLDLDQKKELVLAYLDYLEGVETWEFTDGEATEIQE